MRVYAGNEMTSLKWWDQMVVHENEVVVEAERDGEHFVLLLAKFKNPANAELLFRDINEAIREGRPSFNLLAWTPAKARAKEKASNE